MTHLFRNLSIFLVIILALCGYVQPARATAFPSRTNFMDESIYFLITTRFFDGDNSNNVQCWDGKQYNTGDPAWRGDFKGLIEKLDYIKALGFTAVWITPVVENASGYDYHGYHAMNFKKVDCRYLSENVGFQELIDAVHVHDMKLILDVVFNHTGNFGEETLCPMFTKDESADLGDIDAGMKLHPNSRLSESYFDLAAGDQYQARLAQMKNTDGKNHDTHNYWHHFGYGNWDDLTCQWMQIAGDCVDLNTENPAVLNHIVDSYSKFIEMGVDGFRVDTGRHMSRLVFNKALNDAFLEVAKKMGKPEFFMFAEICTRYSTHWYRGQPAISTPFYTWKESVDYPWDNDPTSFDNLTIFESTAFTHVNQLSCIAQYNDNSGKESSQPTSTNAFLNGNEYHAPDYSMYSGLSVIDFPMHWNFKTASGAYGTALAEDKYYNDSRYNVVYVDSHDYAPDHAPEDQRFAQPQDVWAENLSLMFTFRGIPCLYYGSEIEFKKGCTIDKGPNMPLRDSGRAYFGGYIKGDVNVSDFGEYTNATGNMAATLSHPLSLHIQRLNAIRMAIPALRKGQYSTSGCSGSMSFKRRYTDDTTDSYALVTISGSSTFTNILNGTYIDAVTGDTQTVTNGTLTATCSGKGNMRVYVLTTSKTPAPGKIGTDGKYLYTSAPVTAPQAGYDGTQEELTDEPGGGGESGGGNEEEVIEPYVEPGEQCVFFERPSSWGKTVRAYAYYRNTDGNVVKVCGDWPGTKMTYFGNNVYKYTFTDATIGEGGSWYVLFNDGAGNQTKGDPGFVCENAAYYTVDGKDHIVTKTGAVESPIDGERIYSNGNAIFIASNKARKVAIYDITGRCVASVDAAAGTTMVSDLAPGIYFIENHKLIIK